MIDTNKEYVTKSGGIITNLRFKSGSTFPIKGTILKKGRRPRYQIWTKDGRADVLKDHDDDFDLSKNVIQRKYRQATCFDCSHEWKWVVVFSETTENLSGEKTVYCEKCGGRNVMTGRIKTMYITENKRCI